MNYSEKERTYGRTIVRGSKVHAQDLRRKKWIIGLRFIGVTLRTIFVSYIFVDMAMQIATHGAFLSAWLQFGEVCSYILIAGFIYLELDAFVSNIKRTWRELRYIKHLEERVVKE